MIGFCWKQWLIQGQHVFWWLSIKTLCIDVNILQIHVERLGFGQFSPINQNICQIINLSEVMNNHKKNANGMWYCEGVYK